jgi:hypothetical protein
MLFAAAVVIVSASASDHDTPVAVRLNVVMFAAISASPR